MENNEFKKVCIKNRTCYYFNDIIKLEDFDLDNILIDEKSGITYIFSHYFAKVKVNSYDSLPKEKRLALQSIKAFALKHYFCS